MGQVLRGASPHVARAVGGKRGEGGKETALNESVDNRAAVVEAVENHLNEMARVGVDAPAVADHQVPTAERSR